MERQKSLDNPGENLEAKTGRLVRIPLSQSPEAPERIAYKCRCEYCGYRVSDNSDPNAPSLLDEHYQHCSGFFKKVPDSVKQEANQRLKIQAKL